MLAAQSCSWHRDDDSGAFAQLRSKLQLAALVFDDLACDVEPDSCAVRSELRRLG